jgi:hypothetical protein
LNLLGNFKFFLNREKTFLLGKNAVSNEVTQAEYKDKKPYWFDIASGKQLKADEVGVNNEETENDEAEGDDTEFAREGASRAKKKKQGDQKNPGGQDEKAVANIDCSATDT